MAKKWVMTHEQTEVGFEVINVSPAHKSGCAVVSVKYPTSETVYTYVRKYTTKGTGEGRTFNVVVDGCEVVCSRTWDTISVERKYDTKGKKKASTEAYIGAKAKSAIDSIKAEMESNNIKKPDVIEAVNGPIHHNKYNEIKACLECDIPVYLVGPAGSGKNHTVEQIAEELGWEFYFSNSVQQEYKLTGFIDAGGKYHETEFYKACTSESECVFFLDEMDASIPEVLVLLNAAIANGYFEFPNGRVDLSNVHFVAAGNTVGNGADEEYTGRMVLDQATLDRFAIIEFDYDIRIEMAISKNNSELVSFIRQLRSDAKSKGIRATFSLRCITMVTKLEKQGTMDLTTILKIAVVKGLDHDTINTLYTDGNNKYCEALRQLQRVA